MMDVIKLAPGRVEWREIDGEVVVLDTEASKYLAGNRTAAALWSKLAAGATRPYRVVFRARWQSRACSFLRTRTG